MSDNTFESSQATFASVKFYISNQMLMASFTANSLKTHLDQDTFIQLLASSGFGSHTLTEESLLNLETLSKNNHHGEIPIERHTDASFVIKVAKDQMSARLAIKSHYNGKPLQYDEVLTTILDDQFIHIEYLDTNCLAKMIELGKENEATIAKGVAPTEGEDSKFEVLFNTQEITQPKKSIDGSINYYETHKYITVDKNQPVMKKIPHTKGIPGYNIFNDEIPATDGAALKFTLDETVTKDPSDSNLLLAAKKGHPLASEQGVHIDDTLTIKNASLKSGNIHYDGSVEVTGEVFPNVVIKATGDIYVRGMVENASLLAGNNITIGGGVISSQLFDHTNTEHFRPECTIKADGNITANYFNSIYATAKKDILIKNYSMHSQLYSEQHIQLGNNNGKGVVIGGKSYAQLGLTAKVIGSEAYVMTEVACGSISFIQKEYNDLKADIKRSKNELILLNKVLHKITIKGSPSSVGKITLKKAKKLHDEINKIKSVIIELETGLLSINKKLKQSKSATISIQEKLFSNVHITINDIFIMNKKNYKTTLIHCENNQLHFN